MDSAKREAKIIILNNIFQIVYQTVAQKNTKREGCKFIIKGGASVKYHLANVRIDTTGLTYDIDISPLFYFPDYASLDYFERCNMCNNMLYEEIYTRIKLSFEHSGRLFDINKVVNNGLITMQIKIDDTGFHDAIDFSYIDPNDEESLFVKTIKKIYGSFESFVEHYGNVFSTPEIEMCVIKYGIERTDGHIKSKESWIRRSELLAIDLQNSLGELQKIKNNKEEYISLIKEFISSRYDITEEEKETEIQKDMSIIKFNQDISDMNNKIDFINHLIQTYKNQSSDEYQGRLHDKFRRYIEKYELLKRYLGTADDFC